MRTIIRRRSILAMGAIVAALLTGAGCDSGSVFGGSADGRDAETLPLPLPRAVAGVRAIDRGRLSAVLNVNGSEIPATFDGETWTARFKLVDDGVYPLFVTWAYDLGGQILVLAESAVRQVTRTASERVITISDADYDTSFDFDDDGRSNLLEIDQGSDPLVVDEAPEAVLGEGQGDCRDVRFDGISDRDENEPRRLITLRGPFDDQLAAELADGQEVYFLDFYLTVSGTLLVEHASGLPQDTAAFLYDVTDDQPAELTQRAASQSGDGVPARLSAELAPGVYCYAIGPDAEVVSQRLSDPVLRVAFTPR